MKTVIKDNLSVLLVLLGGIVGFLLRQTRLISDSTGLLLRGSGAAYLLMAWTVLIVVALLSLTRKASWQRPAQPTLCRLGDLVLIVLFLVQAVLTLASHPALPEAAFALLSLLAVVPLLGAITGRKTNHLFLCVYSVLILVLRFRTWSLDPQIAHYSYQLLCGVAIMLATYHQTAADLNAGRPKALRRWSLLGVYLCILSMTDEAKLFYLAIGAWLLCNLITLPAKQPQAAPSEEAI